MADPTTEEPEDDENERQVDLGAYASDFVPSAVPFGPGGEILPMGAVGSPPALPPATPENCMCLRGPCRYFMRMRTPFDAQNSEETTPQGGFKQWHSFCDAIAGSVTPLDDTIVYECSRWDPEVMTDPVVEAREHRRDLFRAANPDLFQVEDHVLLPEDEEMP